MASRWWQVAIVLVLGIAAGYGSSSGLLERLETLITDQFFIQRHEMGRDPKVDDRILLVTLDGDVFQEIGQPVSRWSDDYAVVVEKLLEGGAKAVALDFTFHPNLSKLPWEQASLIQEEIAELAFLVLEKNVVLVDTHRQNEPDIQFIDILQVAAEEQGHMGYNNLAADNDGVVRHFYLFFNDFEPHKNRNLIGVLAELATGKEVTSSNLASSWVTEADGSLRINYPGPPETTFPSVSLTKILKGAVPDTSDKICIIGPAHDSWNDLHKTPLGISPGMEIHAAALNTVLTGAFLHQAPQWLHIVLCLGGCLSAFFLASSAQARYLVLGAVMGLVGYPAVCFWVFLSFGTILPVLFPLLATTAVGAGTYMARYRALENSRRYITGVLGRFVSPQVMQELLADPENLQLGGRRRRITILFADINNFTPLCEKKSPEEVIQMLNDFFEEMLDIIFRYGGTVKQFVGDEIMVLYGAPDEMEDHAAKAVLTAREMVERLAELRSKRGDESGFYDIKVGIHTGEVVVGNIGNEKRSEYAAVGDSVNTAARIEALTKELSEPILVSDETREESHKALPDITFTSKGKRKFKGKADQFEVFAIRWGEALSDEKPKKKKKKKKKT